MTTGLFEFLWAVMGGWDQITECKEQLEENNSVWIQGGQSSEGPHVTQ